MNRYTAQGILEDVANGHTVVIHVPPYATIQSLLVQVMEYLDEEYHTADIARRTIKYPFSGGSAIFVTDAEQARGIDADVILVPHGRIPAYGPSLALRAEVIEY